MPDSTQSSMHSEVENLRAEIRQLQVDLAGLAESLRGVVRAGKAEAAGRVSDTAEKAWTEVKDIADGLAKQVEQKPITTLVSAFSIGMLLGMLFTGRRG